MSQHLYTISGDFLSGLNQSLLHQEILAEVGITAVLDGILVEEDDVTITFLTALSGAEITLLDAVVAAHPAGVIPPAPTGDEMPSVQARRTTTLSVAASWADVAFDTTDVETVPLALEHDPLNADRILVKENSLFMISFQATFQDATTQTLDLRIRKNDTAVLNGSEVSVSSATDGDAWNTSPSFVVLLSAGDFISLQAQSGAGTVLAGSTFVITRMQGLVGAQGDQGIQGIQGIQGDQGIQGIQGVKGDQGDQGIQGVKGDQGDKGDTGDTGPEGPIGPEGAGVDINVKDEGTLLPNTPHTAFDFTGDGVTATDNGDGSADIAIPGHGVVSALAGEQLLLGDMVYKNNVNDGVSKASAGVYATSRVIGVAGSTINSSAYGKIFTAGKQDIKFVGSLTLVPGDLVYLSTTSGMCTNVAPMGEDEMIVFVGYVWNTTTYGGAPGDVAKVWMDVDLSIQVDDTI